MCSTPCQDRYPQEDQIKFSFICIVYIPPLQLNLIIRFFLPYSLFFPSCWTCTVPSFSFFYMMFLYGSTYRQCPRNSQVSLCLSLAPQYTSFIHSFLSVGQHHLVSLTCTQRLFIHLFYVSSLASTQTRQASSRRKVDLRCFSNLFPRLFIVDTSHVVEWRWPNVNEEQESFKGIC